MAGRIVETKSGSGKTKNEDVMVNNKIKVYLDSGKNVLCNIESIKFIGFWD
ncbi:MAG: hypothetical protein IT265_07150 [Saprospiraceae bacterium]|nr:hypothetical protein [Saprospiraceae bacterium]